MEAVPNLIRSQIRFEMVAATEDSENSGDFCVPRKDSTRSRAVRPDGFAAAQVALHSLTLKNAEKPCRTCCFIGENGREAAIRCQKLRAGCVEATDTLGNARPVEVGAVWRSARREKTRYVVHRSEMCACALAVQQHVPSTVNVPQWQLQVLPHLVRREMPAFQDCYRSVWCVHFNTSCHSSTFWIFPELLPLIEIVASLFPIAEEVDKVREWLLVPWHWVITLRAEVLAFDIANHRDAPVLGVTSQHRIFTHLVEMSLETRGKLLFAIIARGMYGFV
mmetsp:Transcript_74966/g.208429  ORF Transcript_74966/g.208429 Transcript_74966/m.208429 type:complete len:278 (-) Transcript_74966:363-1196(-)